MNEMTTKNASHAFKLDIKKYNEQYTNSILIEFSLAHDRFLILDQKEIYHIGASLNEFYYQSLVNKLFFRHFVNHILLRLFVF